MSAVKDLKRRLDAAAQAIESLDADLAVGRLTADEHARRRADLEREAGQLFVTLRRLRSERRDAAPAGAAIDASDDGPAGNRARWFRNPLVLAPLAMLVLIAGVGAGVGLARLLSSPPRPSESPGAAPSPTAGASGSVAPADTPSSAMSSMEVEALRRLTARDDAPIAAMLQLAHVALDAGRLDEARRLYDRVLAREPRNAEALTHVGAVLYAQGRVDDALAKVEEALSIEPKYVHAHWDRTQYLFHAKRDYAATVKAAEAFLRVVPDGPDAEHVKKILAEARQKAR